MAECFLGSELFGRVPSAKFHKPLFQQKSNKAKKAKPHNHATEKHQTQTTLPEVWPPQLIHLTPRAGEALSHSQIESNERAYGFPNYRFLVRFSNLLNGNETFSPLDHLQGVAAKITRGLSNGIQTTPGSHKGKTKFRIWSLDQLQSSVRSTEGILQVFKFHAMSFQFHGPLSKVVESGVF